MRSRASALLSLLALGAAVALGFIALNQTPPFDNPPPAIVVTVFAPLQTQPPAPTAATVATASSEPLPVIAATVLARPSQYTISPGDTFWDIAVRFNLGLDELVAVNPGLNPDLIHPGDVINIPAEAVEAVAAPTPLPPTGSHVAADADGLRLRAAPSTQALVLRKLASLTSLNITGRTDDSAWLEIALADGAQGWVMSRYVSVRDDLAQIAVKEQPVLAAINAGAQAATADKTLISTGTLPRPEQYLSGFTEAARQIYRNGLTLGNNPHTFAVVGDSNSVNAAFIRAFDRDAYDLGEYGYLEDTVQYFRGSFNHESAAAVVGFTTARLLTPARQPAAQCFPDEPPLRCEYRVKKPSVALILIGTNDTGGWRAFESNYREIVEYTIAQGIVPVLITKGDALESEKYGAPPEYINGVIQQISGEYGLPLLDLRRVVARLPNGGMGSDGFHFNTPPDGRSASLTPNHLSYGHTVRNLTALQALDAVRRLIMRQ